MENALSGCLSHQHPIGDNSNKNSSNTSHCLGAKREALQLEALLQPSPHSMGRDFHFTNEEMGCRKVKDTSEGQKLHVAEQGSRPRHPTSLDGPLPSSRCLHGPLLAPDCDHRPVLPDPLREFTSTPGPPSPKLLLVGKQ